MVGDQVVLSAAHCANTGTAGSFQIGQTQYRTEPCTRHPSYPRTDIDLLACKVARKVDVKPATIGGEVKAGDKITIVGYGCVRPGGGGGNDGVLRVGDAEVTGFSGHDIVSKGAGLCFGDSGGPAYLKLQVPFKEKHIQVSVNSKGNIRDTNYTARTYNDVAKNWLKSWAEQNGVTICGVNKDCEGGGGGNECPEEKAMYEYLLAETAVAKSIYDQCRAGF